MRILDRLQPNAARARQEGRPYEQVLKILVEAEVFTRNACGAGQRLRHAAFPDHKRLEDFEFTAQPPAGSRCCCTSLSSARMHEHANVCLIGPPGTGGIRDAPPTLRRHQPP